VGLWKEKDILILEAYPVLIAVAVWGERLKNRSIIPHMDNQALVEIINKGHSSCEAVIPLLRILYMLCLKYNITFVAQHIPGVHNVAADALSRLQMDAFRASLPQAVFLPKRIPNWLEVGQFNPWRDPLTSYLW
jgi:hypothetical protein